MTQKHEIRAMVRGAYQLQRLRIQMGNRVVGNFKAKLGQAPNESEEELSDEGKKLLEKLRCSYKRITEGVIKVRKNGLPQKFEADGIIDTYAELVLIDQYMQLEQAEDAMLGTYGHIAKALEGQPIVEHFLRGVYGCGPAMSGVIVSEIDIAEARYPSSLWKLAGLDVASDGKGRSRRKEHLVKRKYINKDGEEVERDSITFNPLLKTKLMGVLAGSFLRSGPERSPYAQIYQDYKHRLENHVVYGIANDEARIQEFKKSKKRYFPKGHRHNMAMRYMMKVFLLDLYKAWRTLEGLEVAAPYQEAKLGHVHGAR